MNMSKKEKVVIGNKEIFFVKRKMKSIKISVKENAEVVVSFPVVSGIVCEEKLPFFKSLSFKLANL